MQSTYIIDANVFITAKNSFYDPDFHPGFWDFLELGINNNIFLLHKNVYDELAQGNDFLCAFIKNFKSKIKVPGPNELQMYSNICNFVTTQNHWKNNVNKFLGGADPWLIAYASIHRSIIVTQEKTDVDNNCKSPKIPAVARHYSCRAIGLYTMLKECRPIFNLKAGSFV